MKAVIVEIKGEYASALSDDGCFSMIKNHGYETGQIIQLSRPKVTIVKKLTMLTASAAAVLILGVGTWAYASPYSYVSLDVNPSIEYIVNRFDRVLRVNAVNDDGEEILKEINLKELKNRSIRDALTQTVEQIQEAGYFNGQEEGGIVIATSAQDTDKAEEMALELQSAVEEEIVENNENVTVETFSVTKERVDQAKELGVTPGKLNLVEKLQESASGEDSINLEEWLNKPVKDIMKATHSYTKGTPSSENRDMEAKDSTDTNQVIPGNGKDKPDKHSGNGKDKPDKNSGNGNDKPDKSSGNGNNKPDKNSGNGNDKPDKSSGNGNDKPDKNSGSSYDKPDKSSGNGNDKPDKSSDSGNDKPDKHSGNDNDKSDKNSGNDKDKPDKNSNNEKSQTDHNSSKGQSKTDKVTVSGKDKSDKGSDGTQKKK